MEKRIEDVVLLHSGRGMDILREYMEADYCRRAVETIMEQKTGNVLLTTGFYVAGYAETDGPLGTVALGRALKELGYQPVIVTDSYCKGFFEIRDFQVEYVSADAETAEYDELICKYQPVAMISIERCGRNIRNDYANMRGESIRGYTARTDILFEKASEYGIPTIGVGDGGNEIGMGNLKDVINEKLSLVPCDVGVDRLVIATVSNWGAYGMTAYIQKKTGRKVLPSFEEIRDYLKEIVKLGSVDGVTRKQDLSVDGFSLETEREIIDDLHELVDGYVVNIRRPAPL